MRAWRVVAGCLLALVGLVACGGSASATPTTSPSSSGKHLTARQVGVLLHPLGCHATTDPVKPDGPTPGPQPTARLACSVGDSGLRILGYDKAKQAERIMKLFKATDCSDAGMTMAAAFGNAWAVTGTVGLVKRAAKLLPGQYVKVC